MRAVCGNAPLACNGHNQGAFLSVPHWKRLLPGPTRASLAWAQVMGLVVGMLSYLLDNSVPIFKQTARFVCFVSGDSLARISSWTGDAEEYERRYGRWGIATIWDDSLLPCRVYLRHW